jgi:hypothetical protein
MHKDGAPVGFVLFRKSPNPQRYVMDFMSCTATHTPLFSLDPYAANGYGMLKVSLEGVYLLF